MKKLSALLTLYGFIVMLALVPAAHAYTTTVYPAYSDVSVNPSGCATSPWWLTNVFSKTCTSASTSNGQANGYAHTDGDCDDQCTANNWLSDSVITFDSGHITATWHSTTGTISFIEETTYYGEIYTSYAAAAVSLGFHIYHPDGSITTTNWVILSQTTTGTSDNIEGACDCSYQLYVTGAGTGYWGVYPSVDVHSEIDLTTATSGSATSDFYPSSPGCCSYGLTFDSYSTNF